MVTKNDKPTAAEPTAVSTIPAAPTLKIDPKIPVSQITVNPDVPPPLVGPLPIATMANPEPLGRTLDGAIINGGTRTPDTPGSKVLKAVMPGLLAYVAGIVSNKIGYQVDPAQQAVVSASLIAASVSFGAYARDRGWKFLGTVFCLALMLNTSCATLNTQSKGWSAALTAYEVAAQTMTHYCAQPDAVRVTCEKAAAATWYPDLVIINVNNKLSDKNQSISDVEMEAATQTLRDVAPQLTQLMGGN